MVTKLLGAMPIGIWRQTMQMLAVPFAAASFAEQNALIELNATVQIAQQCDAKSVLSSIHGGRNLSPESIMVKAVAVT